MIDDNLPPVPLTRRELRDLERLRDERPVELPKRSVVAPKGRGRMSRTTRRAVAKSLKPAGGKPRTSLSRMLASVVALAFAAALVVAVSVPSNLFLTNATAAVDDIPNRPLEGQSLKVSSDVTESAPVRDTFEAVSYAEALALKYAGVDYSYAVTSGAVRWPFPYAVPITDGFGSRDGGFHKGVDFVPGAGTPIYAIADGVATTAVYDNSGYGQHVVLQHNLGGVDIESLYAHMVEDSSPIVVGQQIKVGDFLGLVGDTGVAYGAHLHFEIHIDKVPVDPFAWLQANAVN